MFRIWAKVLKEDRIQKQFVYESDKTFSYSDFFTYLAGGQMYFFKLA